MQLRLSTKIIASFLVMLGFSVWIGLFSIFQQQKIGAIIEDLDKDWLPGLIITSTMNSTASDIRRWEYAHLVSTSRDEMAGYEAQIEKAIEQLKENVRKYQALTSTDEEKHLLGEFEKNWQLYLVENRKILDLSRKMRQGQGADIIGGDAAKLFRAANDAVEKLFRLNADAADETSAGVVAINSSTARWTLGILAAISGFGILLSLFLTRSITRPINKVIEGLGEGSEQLASAVSQVASASQQLAEGSSEQAASLEETSSSLEEMAAMIRQNAQNSTQANRLMQEARNVVGIADDSMQQLTHSMDEINTASEEIQKIIKTIDEIAFQTNLLALNAAVEAARAGEAGAGFAVVADEVRNLAMRAAGAAKNTAVLIEGTVKKVKDGARIAAKTNADFREVAAGVDKCGELVAEITAASGEQARGIEQLNSTVSEMDRITQQNAANAEESASASEEMNAQAKQMREFVGSLMTLVSGNGNAKSRSLSVDRSPIRVAAPVPVPGKVLTCSDNGSTGARIREKGSKEVKPERVIPLDNENYDDF